MTKTKCKPHQRAWATAKVTTAQRVKKTINRIDVLGFDYKIVSENHRIRILVRAEQLHEVMEWISETPLLDSNFSAARKLMKKPQSSRISKRFLVGLICGAFAGSLIAFWLGLHSLSAGMLSSLFAVFGSLVSVCTIGR